MVGLLLACGVVGGVTALLWPGEREPEYNGKKLSEWVLALDLGAFFRGDSRDEAIQHIGTNGLPFLIKWIGYEEPAWVGRLPAPVDRLLGLKAAGRPKYRLAGLSVLAFQLLGTNAAPAIPELVRLDARARPGVSSRTSMAIRSVGDAAVPFIIGCARSRDRETALDAIGFLGVYRSEVPVVAPVLREFLQSPDEYVRMVATNSLRRLGQDVAGLGHLGVWTNVEHGSRDER